MLTTERPIERKREQFLRHLNELSDEEFKARAQQLEGGSLNVSAMSRGELTDMMVRAFVAYSSEEGKSDALRDHEILYLNMDNEVMKHLAYDESFQTEGEVKFRRKAIHELWHAAKIARGEPIVHPNTEHHLQTAAEFIHSVILDYYEPGRSARKELGELRQQELDN